MSDTLKQLKNKALEKKMTKDEKLKIFGSNLKRLREQASMTKKVAATALGILPQQYYRYEDGVSEPGVIMAMALAALYGVDVEELFKGLDDNKERLLNAVRKLNGFGIKAEPSISGEVAAEIFGAQPVYIPLDVIECLIDDTIEDIKPSVQNNFINALQKNMLCHKQKA